MHKHVTLGRRVVSEGVGTALLLAAVVGSGIMGERLSGGNVAIALLANTIATGARIFELGFDQLDGSGPPRPAFGHDGEGLARRRRAHRGQIPRGLAFGITVPATFRDPRAAAHRIPSALGPGNFGHTHGS